MKTRGNRIFYDEKGTILFQFGEAESTSDDLLAFPKIEDIKYMDLEYGSINYNTHYIESIDIKTNTPIVKQIEKKLTENDIKVQELEKRNADLTYQIMLGGN